MAINLGNIVGNSVRGIASGLDSDKIISELSKVKQSQIDGLKDDIKVNNSKISSYGDLKTALSSLQTAANFLRNPAGILNKSSNVFEYRKTAVTSATLNVANFLSVTANPGATIGKYKIEVGNIAEALQQRSGSFNSSSTSATSNTATNYFNAGTFQVGSGIVSGVAGSTSNYQLQASDYSVSGAGTGIVDADGIKNITVVGASGGQKGLNGSISGFIGNYNPDTGKVILQTTINGVTFTSNQITANTAINSDTGILSGTTINFKTGVGGPNETSFDITLASDVVLNGSTTNLNTFYTDLKNGVAGQSISQSRAIDNFTDANVKSPLTGLTSANIRLVGSSLGASDALGTISGFSVKKSNGSDGAISVVIGNETYRVTGLGTSVSGNITLQSTSSTKQLKVNLADAGVTLDLSTDASAQAVERGFDYAFGTRKLTGITVNANDSLANIAYSINAQSTITGLSASIVKVSEFEFKLSLKSNNVGIDNSYELFDSSNVFTNANITTIQNAEDAKIKVDGVEIVRSTNSIADAIENVTINITGETPDYGNPSSQSADITITNDLDSAVAGVQAFLNAYYDFRLLYAKQTERDAETSKYVSTAVLGGDTTLSTLADQLINQMVAAVGNVPDSAFSGLANIGISISDLSATVSGTDDDGNATSRTLTVKNALIFDDQKLRDYLTQNFDKVRDIFEFQYTSSSDKMTILSRTNAATLNNFKFQIDNNLPAEQRVKILNADGSAYQVNGQDVYADYSAGKISGKAGTALAGLEFLYNGAGNETISVSMSQGIADKVYNIANDYAKDGGILETSVSTVNQSTTDTNEDITRLSDNLTAYVSRLQNQFSALEAAITRVNSILDYLTANDNARNNNN